MQKDEGGEEETVERQHMRWWDVGVTRRVAQMLRQTDVPVSELLVQMLQQGLAALTEHANSNSVDVCYYVPYERAEF